MVAVVKSKRDVKRLPENVAAFLRTGRPWKEPPLGWREARGMHLGGGHWLMRYERAA